MCNRYGMEWDGRDEGWSGMEGMEWNGRDGRDRRDEEDEESLDFPPIHPWNHYR